MAAETAVVPTMTDEEAIMIEIERVINEVPMGMAYVRSCTSTSFTIPTVADVITIVTPYVSAKARELARDGLVPVEWNVQKGTEPDEYKITVFARGYPWALKQKGEVEDDMS
jgi:hypothetical protein